MSMIQPSQLYGLIKTLPTNFQPGTYEDGEPSSDQTKVEPTNFQPLRVDDGKLGAELARDIRRSRAKNIHDEYSEPKW